MAFPMNVFEWFTGGADHPYMTLFHCMKHDTPWVLTTVLLDLTIGAGYGLITLHWWRNARLLPRTPARRALANMRNIFLFCCICGYMFIPLKMFWPAWRLYDMFLALLAYFTWRYAWGAKDLKVVYSELGRTAQLSAELEQSKLEAQRKSSFLNALSHDLRTPLNGIALQAEVARLSLASSDTETLGTALAQIQSNARVTADLLDGLLECARLDSHEDTNRDDTFLVIDVVREAMASVQGVASAKGLYIQAADAGQVHVRTDRRKFERIVSNLLSNAVKFTQTGGVRIAIEHSADALEVHVIDSGIGISPEQQGRLFDEFYQVNNYERDRSKGFGLGLSIARRLARQLGGDITVDSSIGCGSRFTLAIPGAIIRRGAPAQAKEPPVGVGG